MKKPLRSCVSILSAACATALCATPVLAAAPGYTVTWLGFLSNGDGYSYATDINASGQVVGGSGVAYSNGYNSPTRGFIWSPTAGLRSLGEFPVCATTACFSTGPSGTWNDAVLPSAINDAGQVVGTANGPGGYEYAFSYAAGLGMTAPLGMVFGRSNGAVGVNVLGETVGHTMGTWSGNGWSEVGFIAKPNGTVQNLPGLTGADVMYAYDINDSGLIVGGASYRMPPDGINPPGTITYGYRPVVWQKNPGTGTYAATILPGFETATVWNFAHAVNAGGQVVGYMQLPDGYHAFLYSSGTTTDLGCGMAQGISTDGTVVGGEGTIGGGAFMYTQGARYDLNALVSNLAADHIDYAYNLNDSGWVVGSGTHNGQSEAFVLIPDGSTSTAQPSVPCPGPYTPTTPPAPPPPQSVDLGLTITDSPDPLTVGGTLTYAITVTNNGPDAAPAARVSDTLPTNVTFASVSTSAGTCTGTTAVTCDLGDLAAGASATIRIAVKPMAVGTLNNTASATNALVAADGVTVVDETNPADNSATAQTTVNPVPTPVPTPTPTPTPVTSSGADLSITLIDEPDPAVVGQIVVYTAKVTNKGSVAAGGVALTANLPAGVAVTKIEGSGTCTGTGTRTCNLGTIAAGKSKEMKFEVKPTAAGPMTGSVAVVSTTADVNRANNQATATTTVR